MSIVSNVVYAMGGQQVDRYLPVDRRGSTGRSCLILHWIAKITKTNTFNQYQYSIKYIKLSFNWLVTYILWCLFWWLTIIGVARGAKRAMPPQIFRKYSHFVPWEAFFPNKTVLFAENQTFFPPKFFHLPKFLGWLRHCWPYASAADAARFCTMFSYHCVTIMI